MAYNQVAVYGMNERIGLLSYPQDDNQFMRPYSNETARAIDEEVRKLVDVSYKRVLALLTDKKGLVQKLAETLLAKEVLLLYLLLCLLVLDTQCTIFLTSCLEATSFWTQVSHDGGRLLLLPYLLRLDVRATLQ